MGIYGDVRFYYETLQKSALLLVVAKYGLSVRFFQFELSKAEENFEVEEKAKVSSKGEDAEKLTKKHGILLDHEFSAQTKVA